MPPIRHVGTLACTEQEAPCHRPVRQGGGKEVQKVVRGGATGEFREGLPGLQGTVGNHNIVQISDRGADGGGLQLARSVRQPEEG